MNNTLQNIIAAAAGIILAFALYVVPDMVVNLGETVSLGLKAVCATALLIISIAAVRMKAPAVAAFTVTACVALTLLLLFSGWIRLSELGIL